MPRILQNDFVVLETMFKISPKLAGNDKGLRLDPYYVKKSFWVGFFLHFGITKRLSRACTTFHSNMESGF